MRVWIISVTIVFAVALLVLSVLELRAPALQRISTNDVTTKTTTISATVVSLKDQVQEVHLLQAELREMKQSLDQFVQYLKERDNNIIFKKTTEGTQNEEEDVDTIEEDEDKQERSSTRYSSSRRETKVGNRSTRKGGKLTEETKDRRNKEGLRRLRNPATKERTQEQREELPKASPLPALPSTATPSNDTHHSNSVKKPGFFLKHRDTPIPGDTPECMANPLMLISKQRSGFHFFRSLLDQHPKSR